MDITSIFFILFGSTLGLLLRMFIQDNLKFRIGCNIQNISIINFLASFFLGILVAINLTNNSILLLIYIGFLGCFSTFSSFIYQLFDLLQKGKFRCLLFHYFEAIIYSFLCFYLGYYLIEIF